MTTSSNSSHTLPDRLLPILAQKEEEIRLLEPHATELRKVAFQRNEFRGFRRNLYRPGEITLIAEIKQASPSAGKLTETFDPLAQARSYHQGGAHALSILTDEKFFHGSLFDLKHVRQNVDLPVLRKDFIISPLQVYEACIAGADAVLLIVAALQDEALHSLYRVAQDLQMDVLVEVHNLREMDRALDLGADIIGINNRNLHTFEVDIETTLELAQEIPNDCLAVSESGIQTPEHVQLCRAEGINTLLIGETLMRSANPAETVRQLLNA